MRSLQANWIRNDGCADRPLWEGRTKEVVGVLDASLEGDLIAAPLLRPHGFPYEKAPGVLNVLNAPGGGDFSLEVGP